VLKGTDLDDRMYGNGGNDFLYASNGRDVLTGGVGNDTFRFAKVSQSPNGSKRDVITDFDDAGNDVISLSALSSDVLTWRGKHGFSGTDQVRINDVAGPHVMVEVNLSGDDTPELQIMLLNTSLSRMTSTDFVL
jgi:Ca2+-binding RTX toxin-like protein